MQRQRSIQISFRSQLDSLSHLHSCAQRLTKSPSTEDAIAAIPSTDFTFGKVSSLTDSTLWYCPRAVTGTAFMTFNRDQTQKFLEGILGKDEQAVKYAMTNYCNPFIENHTDLSADKKKELQDFCIQHIKDCSDVAQDSFKILLPQTYLLFQTIHINKLIAIESQEESAFLKKILDTEGEKQSLKNCCEFFLKLASEDPSQFNIFITMIQEMINFYYN